MQPLVTIIIPNWNGRHLLGTCLDSLRRQTFRDFETIVVDNGSSDGSVEFLRENYPEVRLIALEDNRGFSAAVNRGIREARGEYIALLNNDTEADPRWLEELVKALDSHPEVGLCASKMIDFHKRTLIDRAGDCFTIYGLAIKRGAGERDCPEFNREEYVFGACAGAAIYRASLFEEIGPLDEDFFAYLEDVDLSFRAQLYGYKCLYVPSAVVYHMAGATSRAFQTRLKKFGINIKNNLFVVVKNMPGGLILRYSPLMVPAYAVLLGFFILGGMGRPVVLFDTIGELLRKLPLMVKKRREILGKRRVDDTYISSILGNNLFRALKGYLSRTLQSGRGL